MKFTSIFSVVLAALLVPAYGQSDMQAKACATTAKTARAVMGARQEGVPAEKMMEPVLAMPDTSRAKEFLREMTMQAYERPRFRTPEMQAREIEEFGVQFYMACMRR